MSKIMEEQFKKQVEEYVGRIVEKSLEIAKNETFKDDIEGKLEGEGGRIKTTDVRQFAECLVDGCLKDGLQEAERLKKIKPVLCVGIVTLDFVTICEEYPLEDSKTMAVGNYWSRGGNAANTATVLAHLGAGVEYFGAMVDNQWLDFLQTDFKENGVSFENCIILDHKKHKAPIVALIISQKTGTRTGIPAFKGITGVTGEQFSALDIGKYSWIHLEARSFEGRTNDIENIVALIVKYNEKKQCNEKVFVSIEVEQTNSTNPEFRPLFKHFDIVFVGKDYARDDGYANKEDAVKGLYKHCKAGAILVCAWGEDGAAAMSGDKLAVSPAIPPEKLIDTVGAGDTFNAGFIYTLSQGQTVERALHFGCMVAGHKCGCKGFSCVKGMQTKLR